MISSVQVATARLDVAIPTADLTVSVQGHGYQRQSLLLTGKGETQEEARQAILDFIAALVEAAG